MDSVLLSYFLESPIFIMPHTEQLGGDFIHNTNRFPSRRLVVKSSTINTRLIISIKFYLHYIIGIIVGKLYLTFLNPKTVVQSLIFAAWC
uniref:Uncharacterized protein n=1 Tax=Fundulus heteroclitus TaxID=8078 RepID=A0A3Q2P5G1_FUNHE